MRVLHLAPPRGSGIADYAGRFGAALNAAGIELESAAAPSGSVRSLAAFVRTAARRAAGFDVVHAELGGTGLGVFYAALEILRRDRTPVVGCLHDPPRALWTPLTIGGLGAMRPVRGAVTVLGAHPAERLDARLVRGLAHAFVLSEAGLVAVRERFGEAAPPVSVLPYATRRFEAPPDSGGDRRGRPLTVGFHGYWYRGKGLDILRAALDELAGDHAARAVEVLVHGAPLPATGRSGRVAGRTVERLASTSAHIRLRGTLAEDALAGALRELDAVVLPYRSAPRQPRLSSISAAAFDALAAGVPVVASRTRALEGMICDEQDGLLVAPDDPSALAGALRRLRDDPALVGRLRTGVSARAAELHAADPAAAWLRAVLRSCAG